MADDGREYSYEPSWLIVPTTSPLGSRGPARLSMFTVSEDFAEKEKM